MKTAFLAALLGVGAQGASELVFKSPAGSGGSATIAFDGTTLTVPQHCRNSVCNDHGSAIAKLDAKIATLDAKLEKALAEIHTKINTTPAPTPAPTPCVKKELASGTTIGETTDQSGRTGYTTPNGWRVSLENGSVYSNGQYYWLSGMFDGSNSCDTTTCATRENRAKLHNCYLYTNGDNGGRMGIRLDLPKETYVDHLMLDPITRTEKDNIVDSFGVDADGSKSLTWPSTDFTPAGLDNKLAKLKAGLSWSGDQALGYTCQGNNRFVRVDIKQTVKTIWIARLKSKGAVTFGEIKLFGGECE